MLSSIDQKNWCPACGFLDGYVWITEHKTYCATGFYTSCFGFNSEMPRLGLYCLGCCFGGLNLDWVCLMKMPRIWSTLPNISRLRQPINMRMARDILKLRQASDPSLHAHVPTSVHHHIILARGEDLLWKW